MAYVFNPFTSNFDLAGIATVAAFSATPTAQGLVTSGTSIALTAADATRPGGISTSSQTFGGAKTFAAGVISDTYDSSGATLAIGGTTATTINIGRSGTTINMIGTTLYENVTNLNVADKAITVNSGGAGSSGFTSGIEVEEGGSITAYSRTSADRNSWQFKAPATAGIVTVTPGAGGFTLDQGSHNPVTLGAFGSSPNSSGASLSTQVLTLQPADATNPGGVSTTTQTIAGNKTFSGITSASLTTASSFIVDGSDNTKRIGFNISGFNTGVTLTLSATVGSSITLAFPSSLGSGDALVSNNTSATLLNKSLSDSSTFIIDDVDATKKLAFSLGASAGSTTLTLVTGQSTSQSLSIPNVGAADSIVTNNTTATLTNKTIAAGSNTISGLTNTNLSGSAAITNANLAAMASSSTTVGTVKGNISGGSTTPSDLVLTSANTASSVVYRDGSGNFSAGTITASITGSASGNLAKATGDIDLTTFSLANSQAVAANVTGLAFANGTVRSASVFYSVAIDATTDLFESGHLYLVQRGADWQMSQTYNGDDSLTVFTVTTAGQVQYTTPSYPGFVTGKMSFRALVTQV